MFSWQHRPCGPQALPAKMSIKKTSALLICDHLGVLGAYPGRSNLPHSVASTCEPGPVVHRRGRSRALAHPSGPSSEHDGFSSCGHRDLKVASHTSRTALLALQVSAEQSVGWMTAMLPLPPIRPIQIGPQGSGQNFDRTPAAAAAVAAAAATWASAALPPPMPPPQVLAPPVISGIKVTR